MSNETEQFDMEGRERLDKIGKTEDLTDSASDLLRRTIGGRGCASVSSPDRFACGGDHQPCLQSKVLCLSVVERLFPHAKVHVRLQE